MMIRKWEPAIVIGPDDQGLEMSLDDFEKSQGIEGYKYELIDGRIEVSPMPEMPHDSIEVWLLKKLFTYQESHPEVINYVSPGASSCSRTACCNLPGTGYCTL